MNWSDIASDFRPDGSLRDIYIRGTTVSDWEEVWAILTADPGRLDFLVDGDPAELPRDVHAVFRLRAAHALIASYKLGKQTLNCHFFIVEEIEFDLDPRGVEGPGEAEDLAAFMARLGRACAKEVRLTPENCPEEAIARYDPARDEVIWIPAAG